MQEEIICTYICYLKKEERQVNSSTFKKGSIGMTNIQKGTGDKIGMAGT